MMIILRGDVREGICSELNRGEKKVGKGARDLAWTRKIAGSFGPERPAHYIVLSFKLYEYLLDRRWDHGRIWRGWGYRGETDVWNEEAKEGRKEGRWRRGAECRIISGLHMRFVFQSIMFGAARTKGVPDPKRDAREKEKEEGKDLSEIVISCYYRTRQISRRNTRGPLPIKLSSSLRHGKPSFFPSPLQRNELKGSKGSRDQFARLSYVPIDAKYPTATSSIAVQYFLSNFLFSLFSPKGKKKKKPLQQDMFGNIDRSENISVDIGAYGRLGLTKEIRVAPLHANTIIGHARLLRHDAPQPRLSEAWNDIGLLPHRNLLSALGDRLVIVTNRPLYS